MRTRRILGGSAIVCAVIVVIVVAVLVYTGKQTAGPDRDTAAGTTVPAGTGLAPAVAGTSGAASSAGISAADRARINGAFGKIKEYASGREGSVTAAVEDLRSGQTWTVGDGKPQDEASVVKVDILQALLARDPGGLPASERPVAQAMITDSDNDSATTLWNDADGATGIGSWNSAAGLTSTHLSPCVECAGFAWPGWGLSTTTPSDQLALLRQLAVPGTSRLSAPARSYALSLMEHVTADQRWGASSGVPSGVTVALKNGWLPLTPSSGTDAETDWQVNTIGWVSGQGRDYLIAVLSTGSPSEDYGIDTVSQIGTMTWNAMG
ncbi:MAG TPA: serine hydrolase [Trebonia sp.]|nr:serine hydrolase [Trebonia sp.]